MTQLHGAQSGHLVRTRRRHRLPAGPAELGRDHDHGLEHGREPPGRLPVGDGGQGARREGRPRRPALHAHERDGDEVHRHPRRHRHRLPRRRRPLHPRERALVRRVRQDVHERARDHRRGLRATPRTSTASSPAGTPRRASTTTRRGSTRAWRCRRAGQREVGQPKGEQVGHGGARRGAARTASRPRRTRRCSTRAASSRSSSGTTRATRRSSSPRRAAARVEEFLWYCEKLCANSGRERTGAFVYAVGWTQHTVGVQYIRTAAIIQLLLGNIGPPGRRRSWRCAATRRSRARPTSRRSTTSCPGYLHDAARRATTATSRTYIDAHTAPRRLVGQARHLHRLAAEGVVGRGRDAGERLLLRLPAAHRRRQLELLDGRSRCSTGKVKGYIVAGENPAVGSANGKAQPARRSRSSTGSSCATSSRSRPRRSGTTAPRSSRAS